MPKTNSSAKMTSTVKIQMTEKHCGICFYFFIFYSFLFFCKNPAQLIGLWFSVIYNLIGAAFFARSAFFASCRLRASTTPTLPLRAKRWLRTNFASIWNELRNKKKKCHVISTHSIYSSDCHWKWCKYLHPRWIRAISLVAAWYHYGEPCGLWIWIKTQQIAD